MVDIPRRFPQILNRRGRVFLPSARYVFDRVPQAVSKPFVVDEIYHLYAPVSVMRWVVYIIVQLKILLKAPAPISCSDSEIRGRPLSPTGL